MSESEPDCNTCEELRRENTTLRSQIFQLGDAYCRVPTKQWWMVLCLGWIALTIAPPILLLTLHLLNVTRWYTENGIAFAAPWVQWSITINFTFLLAMPAWRRLSLFLIAATGLSITWMLVLTYSSFANSDMRPLALTAPLAAILLAIPAFICRVMLGWRIAHKSNPRPLRLTSIASYLVLMFLVAIVMVIIPKFPVVAISTFLNVSLRKILVSPLLAGMVISVLTMRSVLAKVAKAWLHNGFVLLVGILVACFISGTSPFLYAIAEDPTYVGEYIALAIAWVLAFAFWYVLACLWLRWLGYRISGPVFMYA